MKTILALLSGCESDHGTLNTAFAVAGLFHAHVDAVLVEPPPDEVVYAADLYQSASERAELAAQRRNAAQLAFVLASRETDAQVTGNPAKPPATTASYRVESGQIAKRVASLSLFADLIVLPSPEVAGRGAFFDGLSEILRQVWAPVLLSGSPRQRRVERIAIAWDGSLPAAHAVGGAMPLLEKASAVHVLTVQESTGQVVETAELLDYLSLHGVQAEPKLIPKRGKTGDTLIAAARELDCGLLALGAYGHNRTIETVFGGATDDVVVRHGDLLVLVAH